MPDYVYIVVFQGLLLWKFDHFTSPEKFYYIMLPMLIGIYVYYEVIVPWWKKKQDKSEHYRPDDDSQDASEQKGTG